MGRRSELIHPTQYELLEGSRRDPGQVWAGSWSGAGVGGGATTETRICTSVWAVLVLLPQIGMCPLCDAGCGATLVLLDLLH